MHENSTGASESWKLRLRPGFLFSVPWLHIQVATWLAKQSTHGRWITCCNGSDRSIIQFPSWQMPRYSHHGAGRCCNQKFLVMIPDAGPAGALLLLFYWAEWLHLRLPSSFLSVFPFWLAEAPERSAKLRWGFPNCSCNYQRGAKKHTQVFWCPTCFIFIELLELDLLQSTFASQRAILSCWVLTSITHPTHRDIIAYWLFLYRQRQQLLL